MAKKIKKAPVEFPVLNVRLEGKSRSFAIVKHAVRVPAFNKTFTAEQLQEKENAAVVAHLINKGAGILKEIHSKADVDAADKAANKAAEKADKAEKASDKADMVAEKADKEAANKSRKGGK